MPSLPRVKGGSKRKQNLSQVVFDCEPRGSVLKTQSQTLDGELNVEGHIIHKAVQQSTKSQTNGETCVLTNTLKMCDYYIVLCPYDAMILLLAEAQFDSVELHTVDVAAVLYVCLARGIHQK